MWNEHCYLISPSKMNDFTIRRFNIFNMQHGSKQDTHIRIQETIYYAESRFRSILKHFGTTEINRQAWGQKLLHRELVTFIVRHIR